MIEKKDDGSILLNWSVPDDCLLVAYAVEQTGAWIVEAFKDPTKWIGSSRTSSE